MSISEQEAQELALKFIELKEKYNGSKSKKDKLELIKHENILVEKFKYLVFSKTTAYKKFSNYDDLNQDGYEALVMGLKNFDKSKGSIFWWLHKYIDTRIYRSANAYSTVRIPLVVAKKSPPKMDKIPLNAEDNSFNPEISFVRKTEEGIVNKKINKLNEQDRDMIESLFGINKDKITIEEYSKKTGLKKSEINTKIKSLLKKMR